MQYRPDIDGLRALAVLSVIAYHFQTNSIFNGYMGVDIFFVISGFLITKIITSELSANKFTIQGFYERRVKRIFPAFFTVLLVSNIIAYFVFYPIELLSFAKSSLASIFFVSNMFFWSESGYFDIAANLKPLLHTWSLAVEEQFYIIFPLLIVFLIKCKEAFFKLSLLALFLTSLGAYIITIKSGFGDAAFYLFPTRAWELLIGALLAINLIPDYKLKPSVLNLISLLGLAMIVAGFFLPHETKKVMPVVFGTAMIIYAGSSTIKGLWVNQLLALKPMVFIGKISYSLYLWHWPVYVFGTYYAFHILNIYSTSLLIAISFVLSYLSWKYVETPMRDKNLQLSKSKR